MTPHQARCFIFVAEKSGKLQIPSFSIAHALVNAKTKDTDAVFKRAVAAVGGDAKRLRVAHIREADRVLSGRQSASFELVSRKAKLTIDEIRARTYALAKNVDDCINAFRALHRGIVTHLAVSDLATRIDFVAMLKMLVKHELELEDARPWAICSLCSGNREVDGAACTLCYGLGWVSKLEFSKTPLEQQEAALWPSGFDRTNKTASTETSPPSDPMDAL
jgi:hypothetical protein